MAGIRDQRRQDVTSRILGSARRQIAAEGAGSLSMRAVARDVDMVSSAVFRYFDSRDALLTALILESYGRAGDAVGAAVGERTGADGWRAAARGLREWALCSPHEFQLVYGTPVPGYQAPEETIPAAARVAGPFLAIASGASAPAVPPTLTDDFEPMHQAFPAAGVANLAGAVAELAQLIGFLTLELSGHFVGVVNDRRAFYDHLVERQVRTLGLDD